MDNYQGEKFLDKVYKDLHLSEIVMHTANKSDDKYQKIEKYMQRLEDVTKKARVKSGTEYIQREILMISHLRYSFKLCL